MSEGETDDKPFFVDIAKQGRANCKKCKQKCPQGELRIAKLAANPFGEGKMKNWHHLDCLFEAFQKQRPTTKRLDNPDEDLDGWETLNDDHKKLIQQKIEQLGKFFEDKHGIKPKAAKPSKPKKEKKQTETLAASPQIESPKVGDKNHKDCLFREFRRLVAEITNNSSYLDKTELVSKMFKEGSDGKGFKGDIVQWCRLLLPGVVKRVYNLRSKQLVKLFSRIFKTDQTKMLEHLEQGDVSESIQTFFEQSRSIKPSKKSQLTLDEVDLFLDELSQLTREDDQVSHFKKFVKKCTANDLKIVVRLVKHDLRMNAGAKHILDGVHPDCYQSFQQSRDLKQVVELLLNPKKGAKGATINIMTPVLPMLAEACKSVEQAMKKCPNGMYSEIKYDGERVQVHKQGADFKYFSRSLKPVVPYKVAHFKDFIPEAFPRGEDLILDSEILMIDTESGKPLPFGSLGKHKKNEFENACVCLFVFDCIYYNGEVLTDKPIARRKSILKTVMTEIPNHVVFSEMEEIHDPSDLSRMIAKVLKLGLEGLVLKDLESKYEPGKRHWLKVKKDYLFGGAMADSADLIVLGAWYGTGKKGGMMSVFLMGCHDAQSQQFVTVTKVHTGHDDKTLNDLQKQLDMVKISGDSSKVPHWLNCSKTMVPDFVARDPEKQPVWEITGAEFTQHEVHTAEGISIRFPRVTKIREDKNWETATSLDELKTLYKNSKENMDVSLLMKNCESDDAKKTDDKKTKKRKKESIKDYMAIPSTSSASDNSKRFKKSVAIENPLSDLFATVKVVFVRSDGRVMDSGQVRETLPNLFRLFVAFGGTICESFNSSSVTHVVHLESNYVGPSTAFPKSEVKHLRVQWLKDCVLKDKLIDGRPYVVFWKSP